MSDAKSRKSAVRSLKMGERFPFDADDKWWRGDGEKPPIAADWAHSAARGVLADLTDRKGIKYGFDNLDEDVRAEIVASLAEIIRAAAPSAAGEDAA